ncbi:hypothetical protein DBR06_SOUSAS7310062, partial [Sousa chinensis]
RRGDPPDPAGPGPGSRRTAPCTSPGERLRGRLPAPAPGCLRGRLPAPAPACLRGRPPPLAAGASTPTARHLDRRPRGPAVPAASRGAV